MLPTTVPRNMTIEIVDSSLSQVLREVPTLFQYTSITLPSYFRTRGLSLKSALLNITPAAAAQVACREYRESSAS